MSIAELKAKVDRLTPEERRELLAYLNLKDGTSEEDSSKGFEKHLVSWPDLQTRLHDLFPKPAPGKPASELVSEGRGD